jgi:hypothetical protein
MKDRGELYANQLVTPHNASGDSQVRTVNLRYEPPSDIFFRSHINWDYKYTLENNRMRSESPPGMTWAGL